MKFLFLIAAFLLSIKSNAQDYTFGDDMMEFVVNDAYDFALKQLAPDYVGRSLNGYQITLDKARENANNSYKLLTISGEQLNKNAELASILKKFQQENKGLLTDVQIAEVASAISFSKDLCFRLVQYEEKIKVSQKSLINLDQPLTLNAFKDYDLHLVPYFFIINSIGGTKPDFQMSISASVSHSDGSESNENAVNAGFFIFDIYNTYMDNKKYEKQKKKYEKALNLLPTKLPSDTTCYRVYKTTFEEVSELYKDEHHKLEIHLDSLYESIQMTYHALQSFKEYFESSLLDDRVKSAYQALGQGAFNPASLVYNSNRAREIIRSRSYVINLVNQSILADKEIESFRALEDIHDICQNMVDVISTTYSEPIYLPLKEHLDTHLQFFKHYSVTTEDLLKRKSLPLREPFPRNTSDSFLKYVGTPKLLQELLIDQMGLSKMKNENFVDDGLSLVYYWPYAGGGSPIQNSYSSTGIGVWQRGTDGAFIRDARSPGHGQIGTTKKNLTERTKDIEKNTINAIGIVKTNADKRNFEVTTQFTRLNQISKNIRSSRETLPQREFVFDLPTYKWDVLSSVEDKLLHPGNIKQQIESEEQRIKSILNSQTTAWNADEKDEFEKKTNKYLLYAKALEFGGFNDMAKAMLTASATMRAEKIGYSINDQSIPSFDIPDIPFNPFNSADVKKIFERQMHYDIMNNNLGDRSLWFKAAAIVTSVRDIGLIEFIEPFNTMTADLLSFKTTLHFLRGGNEFLYEENMKNGTAILQNTLKGSFTTPEGKTIVFDGLKGKQLDYALVEYEQSKIQDYINIYKKSNPKADLVSVFADINIYMQTYLPSPVIRSAVFVGFNFGNYADRVKLGHRIIDYLYNEKQQE